MVPATYGDYRACLSAAQLRKHPMCLLMRCEPQHARSVKTSSTSVWAILTCHRPSTSLKSSLRLQVDPTGMAIPSCQIALMHASHRGDDMLVDLRTVFGTISRKFSYDLFLRFSLMNLTPDQISEVLSDPQNRERIKTFLDRFSLLVWERTGAL